MEEGYKSELERNDPELHHWKMFWDPAYAKDYRKELYKHQAKGRKWTNSFISNDTTSIDSDNFILYGCPAMFAIAVTSPVWAPMYGAWRAGKKGIDYLRQKKLAREATESGYVSTITDVRESETSLKFPIQEDYEREATFEKGTTIFYRKEQIEGFFEVLLTESDRLKNPVTAWKVEKNFANHEDEDIRNMAYKALVLHASISESESEMSDK